MNSKITMKSFNFETSTEGNKENVSDMTTGNIPEQTKDDEGDKRRRNISSDTLEKINKQVKKT